MTKNILVFISSLLFCLNVTANNIERNNFYIKPSIGLSSFNEITERFTPVRSFKQKSNYNPNFSISIGKYINTNIRTELLLGYDIGNFKTTNKKFGLSAEEMREFAQDGINPRDINMQGKIKRKSTILHIFINTYLDLPINESFDLFLGVGIGSAKLYEKVKLTGNFNIMDMQIDEDKQKVKSDTLNFAYNISVGSAFSISDNLKMELSYIYKDFGDADNTRKWEDGDKLSKAHYKSHNINLGVRYNL